MRQRRLDDKQRIQEEQYAYPYHYIPTSENGSFSQVQYWSWGYRYLGGIRVVLDRLKRISFDSLVDVGCGDGRFLREVANIYPDVELLGIDVSERAIQLARAMNPAIPYEVFNIMKEPLSGPFNVATAIEVLEHIPPDRLTSFVEKISASLTDRGQLVLTVPHANKKVSNKHYQHFTSKNLNALVGPFFEKISFYPFDLRSHLMTRFEQIVGGSGHHFIVTNRKIMRWFFRLYLDRYLYTDEEGKCMRIAAVCKKHEG